MYGNFKSAARALKRGHAILKYEPRQTVDGKVAQVPVLYRVRKRFRNQALKCEHTGLLTPYRF